MSFMHNYIEFQDKLHYSIKMLNVQVNIIVHNNQQECVLLNAKPIAGLLTELFYLSCFFGSFLLTTCV